MSIDTRHDAQDPPAALDPFRIGYRYVPAVGPDGRERQVMVPLTEEDFLHPQEEDRFMITDAHLTAMIYLRHAIRAANARRADVKVFADHRVDFQIDGLEPLGPDVIAFDNFQTPWNPLLGTVPVDDLGAQPMAVIEVTSPATRAADLTAKPKLYHAAGVPYYVVVDVAGPPEAERILAYRRGVSDYKPLPRDPQLGYFVPRVGVWLRWEDGLVVAANEAGDDIAGPDGMAAELAAAEIRAERAERAESFGRWRVEAAEQASEAARQQAEAEKLRAEAERDRTEVERRRADAADSRAEAVQVRADELARELAALKARLTGPE